MKIYIVKDLRGGILAAYTGEQSAKAHLEDACHGRPDEWRNNSLYVHGRYCGKIEVVEVQTNYKRRAF